MSKEKKIVYSKISTAIELDDEREVSLHELNNENYGLEFTNKGIITRLSMSREALSALLMLADNWGIEPKMPRSSYWSECED